MKKRGFLLLAGLLLALTGGCGKKEEAKAQLRFGAVAGVPSMGMLRLMEDGACDEAETDIAFTLAQSQEELAPKLLEGELDAAVMPVEEAAALYHDSGGEVKFAAANIQSIYYVLEKGEETVSRIWHLEGRTVYAAGKGTAVEEILRCLFSHTSIDLDKDIDIQWLDSEEEVLSRLKEEEEALVLLPEPFVTEALSKSGDLHVVLDLAGVWDSMGEEGRLAMSGLLVREEFARKYPEQLRAFLEKYRGAVNDLYWEPEEGLELAKKYDVFGSGATAETIRESGIVYLDGASMEEAVRGYLLEICDRNPKLAGGKVPNNNFFLREGQEKEER